MHFQSPPHECYQLHTHSILRPAYPGKHLLDRDWKDLKEERNTALENTWKNTTRKPRLIPEVVQQALLERFIVIRNKKDENLKSERQDCFNYEQKKVERREPRKWKRTVKSNNEKAYVAAAAQSIA